MRILLLLVVLAALSLLLWSWRGAGHREATAESLRIVCVGGEKYMRCPSECEVDAAHAVHCRCQDFYYQRGDEPLSFSHSLCR